MPRAVLNLRDDRAAWALPDWATDAIKGAFPEGWEIVDLATPASGRGDGGDVSREAVEAIASAEVYFGYGFPRDLFDAVKNGTNQLHWVHSGTAGVSSALYPEFVVSEILFTNSAGIHAPPMAESVLATILHFARGLDFATRSQARSEWGKAPFEQRAGVVREIAGATVGIYGFGGVGRELAWRAAALGMKVIATKRNDRMVPPDVELLRGDDALYNLLERADYLVITAPSTPETRGSIDEAALARMKPDAVLINIARGDVLDERALVGALKEGRLRGAGLDVFTTEPLPPESPLWSLDNVLITPHVSATTTHFWRRETDLIVENIERYLAGRPLRNAVDKEAGY